MASSIAHAFVVKRGSSASLICPMTPEELKVEADSKAAKKEQWDMGGKSEYHDWLDSLSDEDRFHHRMDAPPADSKRVRFTYTPSDGSPPVTLDQDPSSDTGGSWEQELIYLEVEIVKDHDGSRHWCIGFPVPFPRMDDSAEDQALRLSAMLDPSIPYDWVAHHKRKEDYNEVVAEWYEMDKDRTRDDLDGMVTVQYWP